MRSLKWLERRRYMRLFLSWALAVALVLLAFGKIGLGFSPSPGLPLRVMRLVLLTVVFYQVLSVGIRVARMHAWIRAVCRRYAAPIRGRGPEKPSPLSRLPECYDLVIALAWRKILFETRGRNSATILVAWTLFMAGLCLHHQALLVMLELPG